IPRERRFPEMDLWASGSFPAASSLPAPLSIARSGTLTWNPHLVYAYKKIPARFQDNSMHT
ncbi:MAG TPA: hypothetical protein VK463_13865, partial [Desulfomonilaceae bacterium]|nr:hypothetical protein [Desulfomonilaceae bacterium]